jgi:hypothetical protein
VAGYAGRVPRPAPPPLPYTGVTTVTAGTGVWLAALVVLLPFAAELEEAGRLWWIPTCLAGTLLGMVGIWYCRRRAARLPT